MPGAETEVRFVLPRWDTFHGWRGQVEQAHVTCPFCDRQLVVERMEPGQGVVIFYRCPHYAGLHGDSVKFKKTEEA